MKGLIFKDLLLMVKMNKKVVCVMYVFAAAIAFLGENERYALMASVFFSLFIGMHFMMTMTYDGMSAWKQYEWTLPVSRCKIIAGKYLACLSLVPVSVGGTAVMYAVRYGIYGNFSLNIFRFSMTAAVLLPVLWCCVCLALAQWFGYMSVQYIRMAGVLILVVSVNRMPEELLPLLGNLIQNPLAVVPAVLAVVVFSYFASVAGYGRKK